MKTAAENLEKAAIEQQCRTLHLPAVADQCAVLAEAAIKQRQTYLRYLEALLAAELEERERNTITRRIKEAICRGSRRWMSSIVPRRHRSRLPRSMSWRRVAISIVPNP